jgi:toxin CcdB
MARFDVYRSRDGGSVLLDCQSDYLAHLATRFVVPLMAEERLAVPIRKLNPVLVVLDERLVMYTQLASAIPVRELGSRVASLADEHDRIVGALDFLLGGF